MYVTIPGSYRNIFKENQHLSYYSVFKKLGWRKMMFVVLYCDPHSPYLFLKTQTLDDRKFRMFVLTRLQFNSSKMKPARDRILNCADLNVEIAIREYLYMCPGARQYENYAKVYNAFVDKLSANPASMSANLQKSMDRALKQLTDITDQARKFKEDIMPHNDSIDNILRNQINGEAIEVLEVDDGEGEVPELEEELAKLEEDEEEDDLDPNGEW